HGLHCDQVVAGAGSVELIWALARAFAGPGRRLAYLRPAFAEYAQAGLASGSDVVAVDSLTDPRLSEAHLTFVARPGNPLMNLPEIAGTTAPFVVIDEAYAPLVAAAADAEPTRPLENRAVLRSLTKIFALPGLRLGYLLAS